jgi:hypothetical protein
MRTTTLVLLATVATAACTHDMTAPQVSPQPDALAANTGPGLGRFGHGFGPGSFLLMQLRRAPASLQLTDGQRTQIRTLGSAFRQEHDADFKALSSMGQQARAAHASGQSRDQIRQSFSQSQPIHQRLFAAQQALDTKIQQTVLTADQRNWLTANAASCSARPNLSQSQKSQIKALTAQFQKTNKADLDAVKAAMGNAPRFSRAPGGASGAMGFKADPQARAARMQAMASVKPQLDRLVTARKRLRAQIQQIAPPAQNSACFGRMGGGMGPSFRRG